MALSWSKREVQWKTINLAYQQNHEDDVVLNKKTFKSWCTCCEGAVSNNTIEISKTCRISSASAS